MPPTNETPPPPPSGPGGGIGDNAGEPTEQPNAPGQGGPVPGAQEARPEVPADTRNQPTAGGPKVQGRNNTGGVNYEKRYAPDAYGEELNPDARVWNVYNDEARVADGREMRGLKDTIDNLLIFAGLFSAVVTTFVAQSSTKLDPDYAQITASLTYELVLRQRASDSGSSAGEVPLSQLSFDSETYKGTDVWVNGLWLTSLTMSLLIALTAVLARQWIQSFESALDVMSGYSLDVAITREYRREGFRRWRVKLIIRFLPVLLNVALLLFLTGLAVFTMPMNWKLSYIVLAFTSTGTLLYIISTFLPIFVPQCAYKTPIYDSLVDFLDHAYARFKTGLRGRLERGDAVINPDLNFLRRRELLEAANQVFLLSEKALIWLSGYTENNTAVTISAQAIYASFTGLVRRINDDVRDPDIQAYDMRWAELFMLPCLQAHPLWEINLRFTISDIMDRTARPKFVEHDVVRFTVHMRERARKPAQTFALQWTAVLASVDGLLQYLHRLLLHPLVWRDLELALLYCVGLKEIQSKDVQRLLDEDLTTVERVALTSGNHQELTLNVLGHPLVQRPMSFPDYITARGWKEDKRVQNQLTALRKIIPRVMKYSEDHSMADFDDPPYLQSIRPTDRKRVFTVWRAQKDYKDIFEDRAMDDDETPENDGGLRQATTRRTCPPQMGPASLRVRDRTQAMIRPRRLGYHAEAPYRLETFNTEGGDGSIRPTASDAPYDDDESLVHLMARAAGDAGRAPYDAGPSASQSSYSLGGYNHD